ncbi:MAG: 4-alpha-glucanotransferase [Faecalimonas sp.]|nr:4-alpha-glucanotransferase [Faecalimonas sp.]
MRETGILMPVSSLPSRTGVGELGRETKVFLDYLKEAGVKIWQILPLNPVGYGNSPYQPYSSCAGDEIYISLETLYEQGLLKDLPPAFLEKETHVRYDQVRAWKESYLREAFSRFEETDDYKTFAQQSWVLEYGMFRALKEKNENRCWNEWDTADKTWPEAKKEVPLEIAHEAAYQMFLQYIFFCQWMEIKKTANENGIQIMGDVPFYVGVDSVDVWAGKDNFLLDTDGRPTFIAGVPPDYFSATGQRWGNPIYDWDYLKENGYQFWVDRIGYSSRLFDIIRIDHFRAFDTFWKIPATCPTAIEGEWIEAPGYEVIDTLLEKIPEVNLVAEDLGDLRPEVLELKEHYHFKGMKILVFSIDTSGKYAKDIFHDVKNMIIYTGTHDNDTLMEWYDTLSVAAKRKVRRFLAREGIHQGSVKDRLLAYTWKSKAEYAIVPMADILGMGKEAHLNTPGTVGSPNWEWRMPDMRQMEISLKKYSRQMRQR